MTYRLVPDVLDGAGEEGCLPPQHGDVPAALEVVKVGLTQICFPYTAGPTFPEMQKLVVFTAT
jgi:hypothetical protein